MSSPKTTVSGSEPPIPDSLFRAIFEAMQAPCLVLSPSYRIWAVNDAFLDAAGMEREAVIGASVFDVVTDAQTLKTSLDTVVKSGVKNVSSSALWKISNTPVFGGNEISCIVTLLQEKTDLHSDVREQPCSEVNLLLQRANEQLAVQNQKLRESEQRFASFMANLPAVAWIKDLKGAYVYVNPQAERVFPPIPQYPGCTDFDLFPEETARHFRETDHRVLAEGSIQTTEVLRQRDGEEHIAVVTKFPLAGPDGQPAYVAGLGFDITERLQAEEALRESEERFHAIFNLAAVGIAQVTPDGKLLLINQKFCDIIGYSIDELLHLTAFDISHPDDIERHVAELRRLMEGEIPFYVIEKRLITKNRSIVWVHLTVTLVRDQSGQPEYLIAIVQDINERKHAEDALRESEEKFYKIFNLAPIGIVISTLDEGRVVDINQSCERLIGYRRDEVVGELTSNLNVWKEPATRAEIIKEIVGKGELRDREVTVIDKYGRDFWGLFSGVIIEISGVKHLLTLLSDINERKKGEEALRLSEERFRLLAETVPVMIWEAGRDGRRTFLNRPWVQYTGREIKADGEGLLTDWTEGIHPDDLYRCVTTFVSAFKEHREFSVEYRLRRSDGSYGWVVNTGVPRVAANGEFIGYIGSCFDITERKQAKEALQQDKEVLAQKVAERTAELRETIEKLHHQINERVRVAQALEAETAERLAVQAELREKELLLLHQSRLAAMGEMIGNIAHQWRQPLNLLGLLAQELPMTYKTGNFDGEYLNDTVRKMLEAIRHMSQTINDFRNFFSPDKEKVDFRVLETIQRTLSLMEGSLKAAEIEATVIAAVDPVIHGFPNQFAQVVLNIISNAKDEFIRREIANRTIFIEIGTEDGRGLVTITDNAGGIPEDVIDRIFDPYFTTKGPDKGTGVGLYMSKTIIEKNMGGILEVRNVAGGAQFRILI